uniref:Uncharacterized protein n=1 Tax=Oryza sativa subsp. japonica TaxID=39947 RepID=Q67UN0_ORYSJ|nr:hypothetical protein [Oryza sativa Japonica Group]
MGIGGKDVSKIGMAKAWGMGGEGSTTASRPAAGLPPPPHPPPALLPDLMEVGRHRLSSRRRVAPPFRCRMPPLGRPSTAAAGPPLPRFGGEEGAAATAASAGHGQRERVKRGGCCRQAASASRPAAASPLPSTAACRLPPMTPLGHPSPDLADGMAGAAPPPLPAASSERESRDEEERDARDGSLWMPYLVDSFGSAQSPYRCRGSVERPIDADFSTSGTYSADTYLMFCSSARLRP